MAIDVYRRNNNKRAHVKLCAGGVLAKPCVFKVVNIYAIFAVCRDLERIFHVTVTF